MSDLGTEVIGFRQWAVTQDLRLRAVARDVVWPTGEVKARCIPGPGMLSSLYLEKRPDPCKSAPGERCDCGLYAMHAPTGLWYGDVRASWGSSGGGDLLVSGAVVAWGNVRVHHSGFRAQYARVIALADIGGPSGVVAERIASDYGIPCMPMEELPKVAGEFGVSVPEEFRPEKIESDYDRLGLFTQSYQNALMQSYNPTKYTYQPKPGAIIPVKKRHDEALLDEQRKRFWKRKR